MKNKSLVYLFFISIGALSILDMANEDKLFSELENRYLKKKPKFKLSEILNGKYVKAYEEYINDNFIGRDYFINLKSISENTLLKLENNNIIYGKDGYMFEKFTGFEAEILQSNVEAIKEFIEGQNVDMDLMLIPYSASVLVDKYPIHLNSLLINEGMLIDEINEYLGLENVVNVKNILMENKKSYIYYKTDHHWTSYGAYLGYLKFCEKNEIKDVVNLENFKENKIYDFFGTFYSKAKLFNVENDILSYYDMPHLSMKIGNGDWEGIYKLENLEKRDKYSVFLDGNHSKVIVKNDKNKNGKKLLVVKDSFANSFIPFVANNYEEVHVIDLRHYPLKLSEYIEENSFDKILGLYSFKNLTADRTIARIKF
ncbi:MAG: DHHW family protein [Sarcina sp.]